MQEIISSLQKLGKNRSSQAQAKLKPSLDTPTIYTLNKKLSKPKFQSYEVETWYVGAGFMLHFCRLTYKHSGGYATGPCIFLHTPNLGIGGISLIFTVFN